MHHSVTTYLCSTNKMALFLRKWIVVLVTLCLTTLVKSDFTWVDTPAEMIVGQTYTISWTGATEGVTVYVKGSEADSSWRSYVYGSGTSSCFKYYLADSSNRL